MYPAPTNYITYAKLLATKDKPHPVVIKDNTLSITNGHLLIRSYYEAPNGTYKFGKDGVLIRTPFVGFDIEKLEEIGEKYVTCKQAIDELPRDFRSQLALQARELKDEKIDSIRVERFLNLSFQPQYIIFSMTELARYPNVYLLERDPFGDSPIVLGLNWGSCVVLMPLRG